MRKPVVREDDFPTLDNPVRRPNNGGDKKDTYSAPRGDSYDSRDKRDSYEPPRRSGGNDYERRDSYDRRGGDYERRDSYRGGDSYDSRRGGDAPERRDGGYERRDSYDNRRGGEFRDSHDRRGGDSYRRDSYDNRGEETETRGDNQDWRSAREEGGERREYRDRGDREYRDRGDRERFVLSSFGPIHYLINVCYYRASRPVRPKLPLPTSPPYIAYIGNLYFNVQKEDIEQFFGVPCEVRLMTFQDTQKPRGFGYLDLKVRVLVGDERWRERENI